MILLTQNLLVSPMSGASEQKPLAIEASEVEVKERDFDKDFIKKMLERMDWAAFIAAAKSLNKGDGIPDSQDALDVDDDEQMKKVHHALLEVHIVSGHLVCTETGRKFPIQAGIPNMLLNQDELHPWRGVHRQRKARGRQQCSAATLLCASLTLTAAQACVDSPVPKFSSAALLINNPTGMPSWQQPSIPMDMDSPLRTGDLVEMRITLRGIGIQCGSRRIKMTHTTPARKVAPSCQEVTAEVAGLAMRLNLRGMNMSRLPEDTREGGKHGVGEEEEEEDVSYDRLKMQLAKVMDKIRQCDARIAGFADMTGVPLGEDLGDKTVGEIDPQRWLKKMKRKVRRLREERQRLEDRLCKLDRGVVVAWAECAVCGKERITTKMFGQDEAYTCGMEGTWDNIRENSKINCSFPADTEELAEQVPEEYLVEAEEEEEDPIAACLMPIDRPGHGGRAIMMRGCEETTIEMPFGNFTVIRRPEEENNDHGEDSLAAYPQLEAMLRCFAPALSKDYANEAELADGLHTAILEYQAASVLPQRTCVSTKVASKVSKSMGRALVSQVHQLTADGRAPDAVSAVRDALLADPPLSREMCTAVLRVFATLRRADCADVTFQDMLDRAHFSPTIEMVNLVLAAYARDPQTYTLLGLSDALHQLEICSRRGISLTATTFRLVIEVCAEACAGPDWVGLREAMDVPNLMQAHGLQPTRQIFVSLLDCCAAWMRAGKANGAQRVVAIMDRMQELRFDPPTNGDAEALLSACGEIRERVAILVHWLDMAIEDKEMKQDAVGAHDEGLEDIKPYVVVYRDVPLFE